MRSEFSDDAALEGLGIRLVGMGIRLLDEPGRVSFLGFTFRSLKTIIYTSTFRKLYSPKRR